MLELILKQGFPIWVEILLAGFLDRLLGDPTWFIHPVRWIGKWIQWMECLLRNWLIKHSSKNPYRSERHAGMILTLSTIFVVGVMTFLLPALIGALAGEFVKSIVQIIMLYFALASRSLEKAGKDVEYALVKNDLTKARMALTSLVGRDTDQLNQEEIIRATCESLSENTNDGVIAPLFYMGVGSLFVSTPIGSLAVCLVWVYKAVSTLDSMVGYHNVKYEHFGACSARMDDVFAFLPARLSGFLICIASAFVRLNTKSAIHTMFEEHTHHPSPNSGWSEAAAAGALGLRMGGGAYYDGIWKDKQRIGKDVGSPRVAQIGLMNQLVFFSFFFALILASFQPIFMIILAVVIMLLDNWLHPAGIACTSK